MINFQYRSECTVATIDVMGSDTRIASAAWVCESRLAGERRAAENPGDVPGVIDYMMRHRHGSPFEHGSIQMSIRAPIFVWREWHRHRIGFSYNEESARYKTLQPEFYIPGRERVMMKTENWKPGRPKFTRCNDDSIYEMIINDMKRGYEDEYNRYLRLLWNGIDPGLARDNLPVGIFSSCWVTCNPRSMMHFLSLRIHDEDAKFISYPLYEIDAVARMCEEIFSANFPITHAAYVKNGRVAP